MYRYRADFIMVISSMFFLGSIGASAQGDDKIGALPKEVKTPLQRPEGVEDVYSDARKGINDAYLQCIDTRDQGRNKVAALAKTHAGSNTEAARNSQGNVDLGIEVTRDYLRDCSVALERCNKYGDHALSYHNHAFETLTKQRVVLKDQYDHMVREGDGGGAAALKNSDIDPVDKNMSAHKERVEEARNFPSYCMHTVEKEVNQAERELIALGWTQDDLTKFRTAVANGEEESGGGIFDFIADNPLLAVGGVAALGLGAFALTGGFGGKEEKEEEKEKEKGEGEAPLTEEDEKHTKMVEECTENNWVTSECVDHFVGACTSVANAQREGCDSFNTAFCGSHEAQPSTSSAPGMSSSIQYCTLTHARSQCASEEKPGAPACQWLQNVKKSETCKQNPLDGSCLPKFTDLQKFSAVCNNYPQDVVCRNASQGFTVAFGEEDDTEERSVADTETSPGLIESSGNALRAKKAKAQSEFQPANVNLFAAKSPARQLCDRGELYDCQ